MDSVDEKRDFVQMSGHDDPGLLGYFPAGRSEEIPLRIDFARQPYLRQPGAEIIAHGRLLAGRTGKRDEIGEQREGVHEGYHSTRRGTMPSSTKMNVGKTGEAAAVALLERRGHRIVDTNVRFGAKSGLIGELDIVAWDGDTLCFVEVKTRRGIPGRVAPGENVTPAKQRQIARLALAYLTRSGLGDDDTLSVRFDVVLVVLAPGESGQVLKVELLTGAFLAPVGEEG